MKYNIDKIIKKSLENPVYPDERLEQETISLMKNKRKQTADQKTSAAAIYKKNLSANKKFRPAAATLAVVLILACGITVFAKTQGLSLSNIFFNHEGKKVETKLVEQYSSNVTPVFEHNTFKDLQITPIQAVLDGYTAYIIFKVESNGELQLTEDMTFSSAYFYAYDEESDRGDKLFHSGELKLLEQEDNIQYYILQGSDKFDISKLGSEVYMRVSDLYIPDDGSDENLTMNICASGVYKAKMELNDLVTAANSLQIVAPTLGTEENPGTINVAPSGITLTLYLDIDRQNPDELNTILENNKTVSVTLQDGSEVEGLLTDAAFTDEYQTISFIFEQLIDPTEVISVRIGENDYTP